MEKLMLPQAFHHISSPMERLFTYKEAGVEVGNRINAMYHMLWEYGEYSLKSGISGGRYFW